MKRMARWWFQLNLELLEVDLMEEMAIQVEGVQVLVMVEAMALMELLFTKMGMEEYVEYPWMCSLKERGYRGRHKCGVTLLSGLSRGIVIF